MVTISVIFIALFFVTHATMSSVDLSTSILVNVDRTGNGDYMRIQDAIDAVPSNNSDNIFILVKPGVYKEKIVVAADKPFITLSGIKGGKTVITWRDCGEIFDSPTVSVLVSDFMARFITIQNSYGAEAKAVALRVSGDTAAFFGCRILSHQDTLLDDRGRHYYSNCYIEGDTDFIFGNGAYLFENCHLHSLAEGAGAITAQRRQTAAEETGFTFLNCKVTGVKSTLLGRVWGAYSRVVFVQTYMSNVVLPQGWDDWGDSSKQRLRLLVASKISTGLGSLILKWTAYYGEYKCYGPGAITSKRVNWSHTLSTKEAAPYLTETIVGGKIWIRSSPSRFRRSSGINYHYAHNGTS